ncbi:MAG: hypothetical protein CVU50_08630 [Candidatus Cloacimonetes bacterium HGW-Cloacimonetes-3]|nr:MAG: hypothetical protein CVU50_08630 [Candidatus Cloacimonetes bacterium HGW-Cloacimonetes-3]
MNTKKENKLLLLALLTAAAASIHIVESLLMRMFPLPFLRIGLSNVIVLYLVWKRRALSAIVVNIAKAIIGGLITLTLLSPSTLLSLCGGFAAIMAMLLAQNIRLGFSVYGISIVGAVTHNLTQLLIVRQFIIHSDRVFMLTPLLLSIGLISGCVIAYITLYADAKLKLPGL